MKKVYVVTSGSYSDYSIEAIFSTREKAGEFMKTFPDSEYNGIEDYGIDIDAVDKVRHGYALYKITMLKNGEIYDRRYQQGISIIENSLSNAMQGGNSHLLNYSDDNRNIIVLFVSVCWAKNEKHAVKIANEKRVQMIESGEF